MSRDELLRQVMQKLYALPFLSIGQDRIFKSEKSSHDYDNMVNGYYLNLDLFLSLPFVMLSERGSADDIHKNMVGDLVPLIRYIDEDEISSFIRESSDISDVITSVMCTCTCFEGKLIAKAIKSSHSHSVLLRGVLRGLILLLNNSSMSTEERGYLHLYRNLLICFSFLKKIRVNRPSLEDNIRKEYYLLEDYHREMVPCRCQDKNYLHLCDVMNSILLEHDDGFSCEYFAPRNGPGASADPSIKCAYDKYTHMGFDARVDMLLRQNSMPTYDKFVPYGDHHNSTRITRFIAVPKTWKKLRGISAEPCELMYFQQGVLHCLDRMFCQDKWWSCRINLHDQSVSQELCVLGSSDGSLATIDLSAASDSVTTDLVKRVFRGSKILPWLLATRSTCVDVGDGGAPLRILKFAPMGSACCFPVECIIFTLVCEAVARILSGNGRFHCPRVFGDDIIVDSRLAIATESALNVLGFIVNRTKSFNTGFYRESCGMEAWCGHGFQRIYYKCAYVPFSHLPPTMENIMSDISLANSLRLAGFTHPRDIMLCQLRRLCPYKGKKIAQYISFSQRPTNLQVFSPDPTNFNLKSRWNVDLQRREYLVYVARTKCTASRTSYPLYDDILFHQWCEQRIGGREPVVLSKESTPYSLLKGERLAPALHWVSLQESYL